MKMPKSLRFTLTKNKPLSSTTTKKQKRKGTCQLVAHRSLRHQLARVEVVGQSLAPHCLRKLGLRHLVRLAEVSGLLTAGGDVCFEVHHLGAVLGLLLDNLRGDGVIGLVADAHLLSR